MIICGGKEIILQNSFRATFSDEQLFQAPTETRIKAGGRQEGKGAYEHD